MGRRVFVLSDLHLGPGGPLTTFHEAGRLCAVMESWERVDELILAGDVFDFLQVPGYDGFSAALAEERFEKLAANPSTAQVLAGLRALASRPGLELTVLSGNHDPEMLLDPVRRAFEREVGRAGSVRWADDEVLRPRDDDSPPVWGRAVGVDADPSRQVWVVHGDRWDPSNAIDRDALRATVAAGQPVKLPVGSHLVFEVLSKLKVNHRWVDELKPELPAVLPLLLAFAPRETAGYLKNHLGITGRLLLAQIRAALRSGELFDDKPRPDGTQPPPLDLPRSIAAELKDGSPTADAQDDLLAEFEQLLANGLPPSRSAETLSAATGIRGFLLRAWLRLLRSVDRFGRLDGPDSTLDSAHRFLPAGLGALVAGHTHGARIRADLAPPYFNSGTWVPVRTIPADVQSLLDTIAAGDPPPVPSPGSYVRIELGDHAPLVAVEHAP